MSDIARILMGAMQSGVGVQQNQMAQDQQSNSEYAKMMIQEMSNRNAEGREKEFRTSEREAGEEARSGDLLTTLKSRERMHDKTVKVQESTAKALRELKMSIASGKMTGYEQQWATLLDVEGRSELSNVLAENPDLQEEFRKGMPAVVKRDAEDRKAIDDQGDYVIQMLEGIK